MHVAMTIRKRDLSQVIKGWGVWLETVEVTDVKVLSDKLFSNLQKDFREEARTKAESAAIKAQSVIDEKHGQATLEKQKRQAEADAEVETYRAEQQLKAAEAAAKAAEARQVLELQIEKRKTELALARLAADDELDETRHKLKLVEAERAKQLELVRGAAAEARARSDAAVRAIAAESALALDKDRIAVEATMGAANLAKHSIDAIREVYGKIPIREAKLVSFGGTAPGGGGTLSGLLPGLAGLAGALGALNGTAIL